MIHPLIDFAFQSAWVNGTTPLICRTLVRSTSSKNLYTRVDVTEPVGMGHKHLIGSVTVLNEGSVDLVSNTQILRNNTSSLQLTLNVRKVSFCNLELKITCVSLTPSRTPSGKVTVMFKGYKEHYRLFTLSAKQEVTGVVVNAVKGSIPVRGSVLKGKDSGIGIEGLILNRQEGRAIITAAQVDSISGSLKLSGECVRKELGSLKCEGLVLKNVNESIQLSGQKDLTPVLVALGLSMNFMEV